MKRPLAFISASWGQDELENRAIASKYCRAVYEAGYSPICPILFQPCFLKVTKAKEHKDSREMSEDLLRRSRIIVVCGDTFSDDVLSDIALARHLRIAATTLDGILIVNEKQSSIRK